MQTNLWFVSNATILKTDFSFINEILGQLVTDLFSCIVDKSAMHFKWMEIVFRSNDSTPVTIDDITLIVATIDQRRIKIATVSH